VVHRDVRGAAATRHDLIIVGGGIYGATLALEAARRGYRPLLLERRDFGGQTTWNHLRVAHGGLRYLQTMDLRRFRESVRERDWLIRTFPEILSPLRVLMPLYGGGLRHPIVFKIAFRIDGRLSKMWTARGRTGAELPPGRVIDRVETLSLFPAASREGLRGGALWYDGSIDHPERLVMEILRWANRAGGACLNYAEARDLLVARGKVEGVRVFDHVANEMVELRSPVVANCSGPWTRDLAQRFDRDIPRLFRPSLAFNVLLDRPEGLNTAVAVTACYRGARTYFVRPWRGRVLAGTFHAPWRGEKEDPAPSVEQLEAFLRDLNLAIPSFDVGRSDVLRIYAGLLPARKTGVADPAIRKVIHDHGAHGGPRGLYSVSGVKLTTARHVAEECMRHIFGRRVRAAPSEVRDRPEPLPILTLDDFLATGADQPAEAEEYLRRLIAESVVHLDDLWYRRTGWGEHGLPPPALVERVGAVLGWEPERKGLEMGRIADLLSRSAAVDKPAREATSA